MIKKLIFFICIIFTESKSASNQQLLECLLNKEKLLQNVLNKNNITIISIEEYIQEEARQRPSLHNRKRILEDKKNRERLFKYYANQAKRITIITTGNDCKNVTMAVDFTNHVKKMMFPYSFPEHEEFRIFFEKELHTRDFEKFNSPDPASCPALPSNLNIFNLFDPEEKNLKKIKQ